MAGIDTINAILERRDPPQTGSGFLDAVARIAFDRHDVRGCAHLAAEALKEIPEDDAARPALEEISAATCSTKRDAKHAMAEIFAACDRAVEAQPETGFAP